jgi:phosphoglycerate kinase
VRFHLEEEGKVKLKNKDGTDTTRKAEPAAVDAFRASLKKLGDVYVNDAFGTAHRAHSSVAGISGLPCAAGFLMQQELDAFAKVLQSPARPFVAILGGAKVSDKLPVIENLLPKVDTLIIGGAMAYTFVKAMNKPVGKSLVEDDKLDSARDIMTRAQQRNLPLLLPLDHVVAPKLEAGSPSEVLPVDDGAIGDRMGLDIGPKTAAAYADALKDAHTVVWNGPMGVFEIDAFAQGTIAVAQAVAAVKGTTIIGGGDSIAAVKKAGVAGKITHISTGGGASLEWLGGRTLPGVAVLPEA